MADIQTQLPVKLANGTNTVGITVGNALLVDASATTQPVSGTVAISNFPATQPVSIAATVGVSGTVAISNFPATQPVSGTVAVSNFPTTQAVSGTVTASVSNFPSTQAVSGTVAVSNFPSSQTVSVSNFPSTQVVSVSGTVSTTNGETSTGVVANASSATAVANGAVGTITYTVPVGKTLYLKQVHASASGGPCKVVVDYGSSPTVVAVGFWSPSDPNFDMTFAQPIPIVAGTAVNVKITNNAGSAQDVYATICGLTL